MSSRDRRRRQREEDNISTVSTIRSMMFSLFLVGLSLAFVIGFRYYLKGHTYKGNKYSKESSSGDGEILDLDDSFNIKYIMIKNVSEDNPFYETVKPGVKNDTSVALEVGQILEVEKKGTYQGEQYYGLKDGGYVAADTSKTIELSEYLPLTGYIAITYISSGGVRLRTWLDFNADNIAKSVYVGDKVDINARVTTSDGLSAFRTVDGLYVTTDTRYFTDYTNLDRSAEGSTEDIPESTVQDTESVSSEDTANEME